MNAIALANCDVVFLAWKTEEPIPDCLGFAIYRIDAKTKSRTALPAWVGFRNQSNPDWKAKTTEVWPIQKFTWRDLTAPKDATFYYEIVPMVGTPGKLTARTQLTLTTNAITLSPEYGDISAFFNRGILSTQWLTHQLPKSKSGKPSYITLDNRIDQPGDPLRTSLAGRLLPAVESLLERADKEGGSCYCALYELSDPELEHHLLTTPNVHLVLSNTGTDDQENAPARQALHEANKDITDRMLANGHIGHNKFVVYVDKGGKPAAVLTGSTNWTATGICGQNNNAVIIESPELAAIYLDYWKRLKADDSAQAAGFRSQNNHSHALKLDEGKTDVTLWFSPNTKAKSKGKNAPTPSDMKDVFALMSSAQQAILFLAFQPGTPSILDQAQACQTKNPDLLVHGAITDPKAAEKYNTDLYHRSALKTDATVYPATAITDQFSYWENELLKSSPTAHAIIHDKIVVVDPLSENCAVVTGSHNLGYRASYNNDENMLIIRGNSALAHAYAVHVMDVYDHYRWRYMVQKQGVKKAWNGLDSTDGWQQKYFAPDSKARAEIEYWTSMSLAAEKAASA